MRLIIRITSLILISFLSSLQPLWAQQQEDKIQKPISTFSDFDAFYLHPLNSRMPSRSLASISAGFNYSSNAVGTGLFSQFYQNTSLDDGAIAETESQLLDQNIIGISLDAELRYTHFNSPLLGKDGLYWYAKLSHTDLASSSFKDDFYRFALLGNAYFAGEGAEIGDFSYDAFQYQDIQLGVVKYLSINGKSANFSAGLSFVRGAFNTQAHIEEGYIFTEELGEYVDLDIDYLGRESVREESFPINGLGALTDLEFNYQINPASGLRFEVQDLGYVSWKNNSVKRELDTAYRFNGVVLAWSEIERLGDTAFTNSTGDSLERFYTPREGEEGYGTWLPARIGLSYYGKIAPRHFYKAAVSHRFNANQKPLYQLGWIGFISKGLMLESTFRYGAYTDFGFDQSILLKLPMEMNLRLNLHSLHSLFDFKSATGYGVSFGLVKRL